MTTPPAVGKTVSVKVDAQLYDDLTTMLATGMTVSDAVRECVSIIAGTYRNAWASGRVPANVIPHITQFLISGYDGDWTELTVRTTAGGTPRPTITPPGTTGRPTRPTPVQRSV